MPDTPELPRFARGCLPLTDGTKIDDLISRLFAAGETHALPLLRAAREGVLALAMVPPGYRVPNRLMNEHDRPLVVWLAGDVDPDPGPDGFPQATRLFRWARAALIHGAGGLPWHYDWVASTAIHARRVLLVETGSARLPEWMALRQRFAPDLPGMSIQVPEGLPPHPHYEAPAGVVRQ